MKNQMMEKLKQITLLTFLMTAMAGCAVVGGIFKAGVAVGIFMVVAVVVLVIFLLSKMGKK